MTSNSNLFELRNKRVWVAGHRGLVGSALVRRLAAEDCEIVTIGRDACDLRNYAQVDRFVRELRPHAVFLAAATVGGIHATIRGPLNSSATISPSSKMSSVPLTGTKWKS